MFLAAIVGVMLMHGTQDVFETQPCDKVRTNVHVVVHTPTPSIGATDEYRFISPPCKVAYQVANILHVLVIVDTHDLTVNITEHRTR